MAFDDQGFMQKLRMNNVFPAEGRGNPNPLIGMPDFNYPRRRNDNGGYRPVSKNKQNPNAGVLNFERGIKKPEVLERMNTAYDPPESDKIATRIAMGETPNEQTGRALALQGPKNAVAYGNLAIKSRAQDLRERVESGRASDAEKHEYAKEILGIRGDQSMEQIDRRGEITGQQIDQRGAITDRQIETRGGQAMERLGQTLRSREGIASANRDAAANKPLLPSQEGNQQTNALRSIMLTNPRLSQYIVKSENGMLMVSPDAPAAIINELNEKVYGAANPGDISLPAGNVATKAPLSQQSGTPISKTPTSKTPGANDPLGIR